VSVRAEVLEWGHEVPRQAPSPLSGEWDVIIGNPKPQTLLRPKLFSQPNLKPQTPNPKPKTRSPKPQTPQAPT
jgi:hypothetical protein